MPQTNIAIIMVFVSMLLVTEMEIANETRPAGAHPNVSEIIALNNAPKDAKWRVMPCIC